jgi:hypothetical protein
MPGRENIHIYAADLGLCKGRTALALRDGIDYPPT